MSFGLIGVCYAARDAIYRVCTAGGNRDMGGSESAIAMGSGRDAIYRVCTVGKNYWVLEGRPVPSQDSSCLAAGRGICSKIEGFAGGR